MKTSTLAVILSTSLLSLSVSADTACPYEDVIDLHTWKTNSPSVTPAITYLDQVYNYGDGVTMLFFDTWSIGLALSQKQYSETSNVNYGNSMKNIVPKKYRYIGMIDEMTFNNLLGFPVKKNIYVVVPPSHYWSCPASKRYGCGSSKSGTCWKGGYY